MRLLDPNLCEHKAIIKNSNDAQEIRFKWHFPRGTLRSKMSAYELSTFLMPHMPYVLPFFKDHPKVYAEFEAMLVMLATTPREALDRLVPWIKSVCRTSDFDYVVLCLSDKKPEVSTKKYFVIRYK